MPKLRFQKSARNADTEVILSVHCPVGSTVHGIEMEEFLKEEAKELAARVYQKSIEFRTKASSGAVNGSTGGLLQAMHSGKKMQE